ncbi:DUF4173 domain-containing protein [Antrihabitans sp. YC3-6]|uniref:DUF4173 domain-containing protein n=1 Tax=Antrihabitans stalagmiti TaxID=2799499 RepID=A0A934U3X2_9NOCA|nr:DUF4173 domain-containing protein [Antrihabitans stalagmiti]MBJ8340109.1 DUF4173 domain-containing protein [Antrihabitans stalagmiti]
MTTAVTEPGKPQQPFGPQPVPVRRATIWPEKVWPATQSAAASWQVLAATLVVGWICSIVWHFDSVSIGFLLTAILVFGVAFGTARRRPTATEAVWIALTLALLSVPAFRDASWLAVLCILASWGAGWTALVGGRTWTSIFFGAFVVWMLPARVLGWTTRGGRVLLRGKTSGRKLRILGVAALTVVLVGAFGALFAGADPAFAHLVAGVTPDLDAPTISGQVFVGVFAMVFVLASSYLVLFVPKFDAIAPAPGKSAQRWEWAVPLSVLAALFVVFVGVQITVLFGGSEHVLRTENLTYAEYARQGFWQLLAVTALILLVLAVAIRKAPRESSSDRTLARSLIGVLCVSSMVIVSSAVFRMWTYEQAYGFTELRLLVTTIELWLGSIFLMICVAGVKMSAPWLPRAVVGAGVVALLVLAAWNPDAYIADRNIDRYDSTGKIDVSFLSTLSADAVPEFDRLPEPMRSCLLSNAADRLDESEPWYRFNLSRTLARATLDDQPKRDSNCLTTVGR